MTDTEQQAWVLRMHTGGGDVVADGLREGLLLVGWSGAEGLAECHDYWDFREIVHAAHYADDSNYRRSGQAASQLWNFMHEMREGDLVVVPAGPTFFLGEIAGPAYEVDWEELPEDTSHRRAVRWLNESSSIPRRFARAALISRMNCRKTVTAASDVIAEIREAAAAVDAPSAPSLAADLRAQLVQATKTQLLSGHMDERRFEILVRDLVLALGATNATIVPRLHDVGADIEADFSVGQFVTVPVRIQVKWWKGDAGVAPIDQLIPALDEVDLGVVITTADFDEEARQYADKRAAELGKQIQLVDGDELCRLIVDFGLEAILATDQG